ncbi:MAG: hypothetical protein AAF035_09025 [Pseudomonadota bacterium]
MITEPRILWLAYGANILILVPVCWAMIWGGGTTAVFENRVADSDGLRLLVASLWSAILIGSVAGLIWPAFFAPLLLVQIVYKSLWLILFVAPFWIRGEPYPVGISAVFIAIVFTYPAILWAAQRM